MAKRTRNSGKNPTMKTKRCWSSTAGGLLLSSLAVRAEDAAAESGSAKTVRRLRTKDNAGSQEMPVQQDMGDIWEKASRIARTEIESLRLLHNTWDSFMSMPSEDRPSRPPASVPTPVGPTPSPVDCLMGRTREEYLFDLLSPITPPEELNDPSTPQGMAFDFMVNDDPALKDPCAIDTIQQRYGLTTLYFSTEGDKWFDDAGWLGPDLECEWFGVECYDASNIVAAVELRKYRAVP